MVGTQRRPLKSVGLAGDREVGAGTLPLPWRPTFNEGPGPAEAWDLLRAGAGCALAQLGCGRGGWRPWAADAGPGKPTAPHRTLQAAATAELRGELTRWPGRGGGPCWGQGVAARPLPLHPRTGHQPEPASRGPASPMDASSNLSSEESKGPTRLVHGNDTGRGREGVSTHP